MLKVVDVSNWQATLDIATVDADVVAVKATEGNGYTSPSFQEQWKAVEDSGKGRIAYHYLHPSISAVAQMRHFLNVVEEAGLESDDCLAIDLEDSDGISAELVSECARVAVGWLEEETKCKVIIYTYINFAESGNCIGLGSQPLWIADPSSPPGRPRIPAPWKDWLIHQYSVQKGVDRDLLNSDNVADLLQYAVLPKAPPLQPDQRVVWLSDGTTQRDTIVHESALVAGFSMVVGEAEFKILQ